MIKLRFLTIEICQCVAKSNVKKSLRNVSSFPVSGERQHFATNKFLKENYKLRQNFISYYSTIQQEVSDLDPNLYEEICEETLQSLAEFFEELVESDPKFAKGDVNYSDGVLTVDLATSGTYVINRQSPNKQIWLSSPISGPKRYDYLLDKDCWIYKREQVTLHCLLQNELSKIFNRDVSLGDLSHCKLVV